MSLTLTLSKQLSKQLGDLCCELRSILNNILEVCHQTRSRTALTSRIPSAVTTILTGYVRRQCGSRTSFDRTAVSGPIPTKQRRALVRNSGAAVTELLLPPASNLKVA